MLRKDKTAHWHSHFSFNYKSKAGFTNFYLFPTIEYSKEEPFDDNDNSFSISFEWLFWSFTVTRYWGSVYKR